MDIPTSSDADRKREPNYDGAKNERTAPTPPSSRRVLSPRQSSSSIDDDFFDAESSISKISTSEGEAAPKNSNDKRVSAISKRARERARLRRTGAGRSPPTFPPAAVSRSTGSNSGNTSKGLDWVPIVPLAGFQAVSTTPKERPPPTAEVSKLFKKELTKEQQHIEETMKQQKEALAAALSQTVQSVGSLDSFDSLEEDDVTGTTKSETEWHDAVKKHRTSRISNKPHLEQDDDGLPEKVSKTTQDRINSVEQQQQTASMVIRETKQTSLDADEILADKSSLKYKKKINATGTEWHDATGNAIAKNIVLVNSNKLHLEQDENGQSGKVLKKTQDRLDSVEQQSKAAKNLIQETTITSLDVNAALADKSSSKYKIERTLIESEWVATTGNLTHSSQRESQVGPQEEQATARNSMGTKECLAKAENQRKIAHDATRQTFTASNTLAGGQYSNSLLETVPGEGWINSSVLAKQRSSISPNNDDKDNTTGSDSQKEPLMALKTKQALYNIGAFDPEQLRLEASAVQSILDQTQSEGFSWKGIVAQEQENAFHQQQFYQKDQDTRSVTLFDGSNWNDNGNPKDSDSQHRTSLSSQDHRSGEQMEWHGVSLRQPLSMEENEDFGFRKSDDGISASTHGGNSFEYASIQYDSNQNMQDGSRYVRLTPGQRNVGPKSSKAVECLDQMRDEPTSKRALKNVDATKNALKGVRPEWERIELNTHHGKSHGYDEEINPYERSQLRKVETGQNNNTETVQNSDPPGPKSRNASEDSNVDSVELARDSGRRGKNRNQDDSSSQRKTVSSKEEDILLRKANAAKGYNRSFDSFSSGQQDRPQTKVPGGKKGKRSFSFEAELLAVRPFDLPEPGKKGKGSSSFEAEPLAARPFDLPAFRGPRESEDEENDNDSTQSLDRYLVKQVSRRFLERETSVLEPFASRPVELGPFATRPTGVGPLGVRPAVPGDAFSIDEPVVPDDDDNISTSSLDRYIVKEASKRFLSRQCSVLEPFSRVQIPGNAGSQHRGKKLSHKEELKKKVSERREKVTSMLHATTKHTQDDSLDMKRKLVLSQSLNQKLERENAAIQRQAILDVARLQITLLEQRNSRELELEQQLKIIMSERDAAVQECNYLISGTCDLCRRRFEEDKEYVMDNYVRDPVLEQIEYNPDAAFEWYNMGNRYGRYSNYTSETKSMSNHEESKREEGNLGAGINTAKQGKAENQDVSVPNGINEIDTVSQPPISSIEIQTDSRIKPKEQQSRKEEHIFADKNDQANELKSAEQQTMSLTTKFEDADTHPQGSTGSGNRTRTLLSSLFGAKSRADSARSSVQGSTKSFSKTFSFFDRLTDEIVDEEVEFAPIDPILAVIPETMTLDLTTKKTSVFDIGNKLRTEQVFDGVEASSSFDLKPPSTRAFPKTQKSGFGLAGEEMNIEDHDRSLLFAVCNKDDISVIKEQRKPKKTKTQNSWLAGEEMDIDDHDRSLLFAVGSKDEVGAIKEQREPKKTGILGLKNETSATVEQRNISDGNQLWLAAEERKDEDKTFEQQHNQQTKDAFEPEDDKKSDAPVVNAPSPQQKGFIGRMFERIGGLNILQDTSETSQLAKNEDGGSLEKEENGISRLSDSGKDMHATAQRDEDLMSDFLQEKEYGEKTKPSDEERSNSGKDKKVRDSMTILAPIDVEILGDRPWRSDTGGKKLSSTKLSTIEGALEEEGQEERSTASSDSDNFIDALDGMEHVASLLKRESSKTERLDLKTTSPKHHISSSIRQEHDASDTFLDAVDDFDQLESPMEHEHELSDTQETRHEETFENSPRLNSPFSVSRKLKSPTRTSNLGRLGSVPAKSYIGRFSSIINPLDDYDENSHQDSGGNLESTEDPKPPGIEPSITPIKNINHKKRFNDGPKGRSGKPRPTVISKQSTKRKISRKQGGKMLKRTSIMSSQRGLSQLSQRNLQAKHLDSSIKKKIKPTEDDPDGKSLAREKIPPSNVVQMEVDEKIERASKEDAIHKGMSQKEKSTEITEKEDKKRSPRPPVENQRQEQQKRQKIRRRTKKKIQRRSEQKLPKRISQRFSLVEKRKSRLSIAEMADVLEEYEDIDVGHFTQQKFQCTGEIKSESLGVVEEYSGSILKGLKKFMDDPNTFMSIIYETSLLQKPVSEQKYKLVHRSGTKAFKPWVHHPDLKFTMLVHKYQPAPSFKNDKLPEEYRDAYTNNFEYFGKKVCTKKYKPFLPGRGMGFVDEPNIKIIGEVDPSDIAQGTVGDCWLLSAIACLSEFDGAIRRLFRHTKGLHKMPFRDGRPNMYTVTLWDLTKWKEVDVVIDERLCLKADGTGLLGAKPSADDNELWVPYLEKALACHWCVLTLFFPTDCTPSHPFVSFAAVVVGISLMADKLSM